MIPKYARYQYCIEKSIDFIFSENLNIFPFDCDNIIRNHKWARLKYTNLAKQFNVSIDEIIDTFSSQDGYSSYSGRNYTIAYNNTHLPKRIYFTKLHEIGHIYLNHFIDFDETIIKRSNFTEEKYRVLEKEANCFARNVIAPAVIVKTLNLNTKNKISNYFGITNKAADTRLGLLEDDYKYISTTNRDRLLAFWNDAIYKKQCLQCGYSIHSKVTKHCPICGHNKLFWGDGKMIYTGIELDEKGRAKICPQCENEEIQNTNNTFCSICGTNLYNRCTNPNCGTLLKGNARYCGQCGSPSSFFQNNFLETWEVSKVDDELPF
nr:ImmA/IrrE family metallo-endopeptidase [Clostridium neonatale]